MLKLLEHLKLPNAIIVGHDMGSAVALVLAAHHPEVVRALAITNTLAFDAKPSPVVNRLAALARVSPLSIERRFTLAMSPARWRATAANCRMSSCSFASFIARPRPRLTKIVCPRSCRPLKPPTASMR